MLAVGVRQPGRAQVGRVTIPSLLLQASDHQSFARGEREGQMGLEFSIWPADVVARYLSVSRVLADGFSEITSQQVKQLEAMAAATDLATHSHADVAAFVAHVLSEAAIEVQESDTSARGARYSRGPSAQRHASSKALASSGYATPDGGTLVRIAGTHWAASLHAVEGRWNTGIVQVTSTLAVRADGAVWRHSQPHARLAITDEVLNIASSRESSAILTSGGLVLDVPPDFGAPGARSPELVSPQLGDAPTPREIIAMSIDQDELTLASVDGRVLAWRLRDIAAERGRALSPDVAVEQSVRRVVSGRVRALLSSEGAVLPATKQVWGSLRTGGRKSDRFQPAIRGIPPMKELTSDGLMLDHRDGLWLLTPYGTAARVAGVPHAAWIRDDVAVTAAGDLFEVGPGANLIARRVSGLIDVCKRRIDGSVMIVTSEPDAVAGCLSLVAVR